MKKRKKHFLHLGIKHGRIHGRIPFLTSLVQSSSLAFRFRFCRGSANVRLASLGQFRCLVNRGTTHRSRIRILCVFNLFKKS